MDATPDTIWRPILLLAILIALIGIVFLPALSHAQETTMTSDSEITLNKLTPEEERVIVHKGTEMPGTGKYDKFFEEGTYTCKQCGAELYRSSDKFNSGCGWPAFDDEIRGAVHRSTDADGFRVEITCARCGGHLGHVFTGEHLTDKNVRHCVNSISMDFVPAGEKPAKAAMAKANDVGMAAANVNATVTSQPKPEADAEPKTKTAYFAGGCFWGVEYYLEKLDGVIDVRSGFMNGTTEKPSYKEVCYDKTGHAEAVEVVYDPSKTDYETIARQFFEIHDPTQVNRQGPDIGDQYRSAVFYVDAEQKAIAEKLIGILEDKGLDIATQVEKAGPFYVAEDYHQDYYEHKGTEPYCHGYTKRF
jgi:peptide methionine sulfoxide reductase msrA/msrB